MKEEKEKTSRIVVMSAILSYNLMKHKNRPEPLLMVEVLNLSPLSALLRL